MKKYPKSISASLVPRKEQALDTLYMIRDIYESDTSDLLTGGMYDDFMRELNTQIDQISRTVASSTDIYSADDIDDDFVVRTPKKLDEAYLNYRGTKISKYMPKSQQAELRKTKAQYKKEMESLRNQYKQYVYRCVAESPQIPDPDEGEEAWSAYARDAKEYKDWCFADGVEDGLFDESDYDAFDRMWKQAETDMAQPYA